MTKTVNTTPNSHAEGWRTTIDSWVHDADIRRHGLIALAMVLITAALVVGLVSGTFATVVTSLLPSVLAKSIAGGILATASGTGLWLRLRRRKLIPTLR